MASLKELTIAERRLIKGMLQLQPSMENQAILAYFTRPGRHINHARIAEIKGCWWFADLTPATPAEVDAFMTAASGSVRPDPDCFVTSLYQGSDEGIEKKHVGSLHLNWWPVGQGLYASGLLRGANGRIVSWVYDCGTAANKKRKLVDRAIIMDQAHREGAGTQKINLAVLSHFDRDHISGFTMLAGQCKIEKLLLPYLPLWRRLVVAIEQGIAVEDPAFPFFIDPVAYLRGIPGNEIEEIIFVPGVGPEDIAGEPEGPIAPEGDPAGPREGRLEAEIGELPPEARGDPTVEPNIIQPMQRARFLAPGGRVVSPDLWEFVPYNDVSMLPKATPAFITEAVRLATILKDDKAHREQALKDIKAHYASTFGSSAEEKNIISLFLYSGPIGRRLRLAGFSANHAVNHPELPDRFAQIHTGDGTLNKIYYPGFRDFFRKGKRFEKMGIVQVMHHGSRRNWAKGIADKLRPVASIFSSEPCGHYFHPDDDVLRDFWPYHPAQVDSKTGFHATGYLVLR
jgi:beta-lactamase superfamily II metal-dependent hydrolase